MTVCISQASDAWRHAAENEQILVDRYDQPVPPILIIYSEGGPDHCCKFLSVMYTMVHMFTKLDLDYLILARNAPGHSWRNPAERVMSVLNLGLQGTGVMREESSSEDKIKRCEAIDTTVLF